MKNKFLGGIFGEKRFVFDGEPGAPGQVRLPDGQASEAPVEGRNVEAEKEAKKESVTAKTSEYLKDLKDTIGKNFGDLVELVNFEGEVFEGEVVGFDFMNQKDIVFAKVLEMLDKKLVEVSKSGELERLTAFFAEAAGGTVDLEQFIADVYTTSMLQAVEASFKERYPLFDTMPDKDKYKIGYKIDVANGGVSFLTEFKGDDAFEAGYKKLEEEEGISRDVSDKGEGKEGDKKKEEDKDKKGEGGGEESEAMLAKKEAEEKEKKLVDKEAKIKALKGSFLGGALAFLGIVKNDEWGDVVDGNNWLASLLVGAFGGGALLAHDPFKDAIAKMDGKHKALAEGLHQKAKGSFFSLEGVGMGEVSPEEAKKLQEARSIYDEKKFGELIAGKIDRDRKIPDEGIKLGVDFGVKDGDKAATLVVDLKNGGEMIIPPKSTLVVNGETEVSGDKEKKYDKNNTEIKITGTIPKGTVFKGKVGFEVVTETA